MHMLLYRIGVGARRFVKWRLPTPAACIAARRASSSTPGLFGTSFLYQPADFQAATAACKARVDGLLSLIEGDSLSPVQTLEALDSLSNELCLVLDAAETCRSVTSDEAWRTAATACSTALNVVLIALNARVPLYSAVRRITEDAAVMSSLTAEQRSLAVSLLSEFEREGVHVPRDGQTAMRSSKMAAAHAGEVFTQGVHECVENARPVAVTASSSRDMQAVYGRFIVKQAGDVVLLHPACVDQVLSHGKDSRVRAEVANAHARLFERNVSSLDALRSARSDVAHSVGFPSYAHMHASSRMCTTPEAALRFLQRLSIAIAPCALQELADLTTGSTDASRSLSDAARCVVDAKLEPHDLPFLRAAAVQRLQRSSSLTLPVTTAVDMLKSMLSSVYGLRVHDAGEGRLELFSSSGTCVGALYLMLGASSGAHYVIQCGKKYNAFDTRTEGGTGWQLPALVLTVPSSDADLLTGAQLETMFHEFGHAVHSLASRTQYQHLSGTRCALDFVEIPSTFHEYFARHLPLFVVSTQATSAQAQQFATFWKSHRRGRALALQSLIADAAYDLAIHTHPCARGALHPLSHMFQEWTSLSSIARGLTRVEDTAIADAARLALDAPAPASLQVGCHESMQTPSTSSNRPFQLETDVNALYVQMHDAFTFTSVHRRSTHGAGLTHLHAYGGGYYTYALANVVAADLWAHVPPRLLWDQLLVHGGAMDAYSSLTDVLGHVPDMQALRRELTAERTLPRS